MYDKPKKVADKTIDTINLSLEYPFLRDIISVLIHIGVYGELNKTGDSLVISGSKLHTALKGARVSKVHEYLQHLTNCGIYFSGIDSDRKKPDLSKVERLEVSCNSSAFG